MTPRTTPLADWLAGCTAALLGRPAASVDPSGPIAELRLSSWHAVSLAGDLTEYLGRPVEPTVFWEHPTLAGIAAALEGGPAAAPSARPEPSAVPAGPGGDPVAVVGIGLRVPGASSPEQLWELFERAGTTARPLDLAARTGSAQDEGRSVNGSFLDDVYGFDPAFFGISPREAAAMDPQQRLLLETAWEALEDAGTVPAELAGTATGVFVGISGFDHGRRRYADPGADLYTGTGSALSVAANRLSYLLDLRGPSLAVDTACSSSLVAVHQAVRSLQFGESDTALVGGVNVILDDAVHRVFDRAGFLSPDGRCKTFDAAADGYGRGEGAVVLVLKRLSAARAAGDRVYGLIRAAVVNQDGRSNGLTAPNGAAQEELLRRACRQAGVTPAEVGYVEAHGTGTPLGDPIEAHALGRVFGAGRDAAAPCLVGSAKANVGHLESAAGAVGLVKALLCVQRRRVPPAASFASPNPHVDFAALGLRVPRETTAWPDAHPLALAGVSSFGFGGTNAHVLVGEVPRDGENPAADAVDAVEEDRADSGETVLLPLSAADPQALAALAAHWAELLERPAAPALPVLAATAATRRTHHRHRLAVVAADRAGAAELLRAARPAAPAADGPPHPVFVFSGQGGQWPGMAADGLRGLPAAARTLAECHERLEALAGWSLLDALRDGAALTDPGVLQPALVALQIALAAQWRDWGVTPAACVGHSLGEVSAAAVAGALDLDDALFVALCRGELMREAPAGATAFVELDPERAAARAAGLGVPVDVAAWNAPGSCVLAGPETDTARLLETLAAEGVFTRRLPGRLAFHSRLMEPLRERLADALDGLAPRPGRLPLYSTVTGGRIEPAALTPRYWADNLRRTVRFAPAAAALAADGHRAFLEIGPHPALTAALRGCLEQCDGRFSVHASMRRDTPARDGLLRGLAELYEQGAWIDWARVADPDAARPAPAAPAALAVLPRYPWRRESGLGPVPAPVPAPGDGAPRSAEPGAEPGAGPAAESVAELPDGRLRAALAVATAEEQARLITERLIEETARVLRMPASRIDPAQPMNSLGLDSIMAMELRRRLERELDMEVPVTGFLSGAGCTDLGAALAAEFTLGGTDQQTAELLLSELDRLSPEEVDVLLERLGAGSAQTP
ncbi:type I polyketide synthase [Kitasatospora fiedleri]|uniref:type I polyketide synthase n=1 Tax=Kitasatospora fiedleri TaxID=2991545 RepID=UPI00249A968A|nr:beta-ketoacyl synthase N-terminal-like domain-containing protein [Kitasatospora fiedleri]